MNTKSLNDRDLEILDILGFDFDAKQDLSTFLAKTIRTADVDKLHDQGVPLRSVRMILKKVNPYHRIFIVNRKQQKPAPCFCFPVFF